MKDTFHVGDLVWILPYDDVQGGAHGHVSISRRNWVEGMVNNPHYVAKVSGSGNVCLKGSCFYWPPLGLTKVEPGSVSVALEDLL